MQIEQVQNPGDEWDEFVEATPGANLGHASAWASAFRNGYGLTTHYLAARAPGGGLRGVLPLVVFRSLRGRRELISLPFLDIAGPLAEEVETGAHLIEAARRALSDERGEVLELRGLAGAGPAGGVDRVDLAMALQTDEERQWKAVGAKVRNQTRKAEKSGLQLLDAAPDALLDGFYGPFCLNMRDLGSPVHGRRFFEAAARAFGERWRFVVTADGGRSVGGLVAIRFADTVSVPWASTLRSERKRCPNNQIYWEALRWAIEVGASTFDFGRSPREAGTYRFKVGWGAEERALRWQRESATGAPIEAVGLSESPVMQKLSGYWTKLPQAVADALGPVLRKRISS